ncbi:hypothetical protein [Nitrosomonas communis]|uniref:Uncharacterized protein n=1 Tax=Nitrosomonas communis TaxID=44574 RepID=A0A1I4QJA4_9PROT|nr:hypothetical protein [Nitrosomonas communis]SFM40141.1 hypothetical protein SAMN05421863_10276 [Nitrosomonas communis]
MKDYEQFAHNGASQGSLAEQIENILSTSPTHRTTSEREAMRCVGEVDDTSIEVSQASKLSSGGTTRSNTVPNNCNSDYFKLLRFGVDSLYLSYPGELLPDVDDELKELKKTAQLPQSFEQIKAQYSVNDHIFEVKDKGAKLFP